MEERVACALLKQRFEAAGFTIEDNRPFDEDGVRFEIDGFDPRHRVGYEYATDEAGDSWDVDDAVIAALGERHRRGEVHVLVLREADAPDAETLGRAADAFLAELRERGVGRTQPPPAPDEANSEPAQTIAIPDVASSEPAQAIAIREEVQATEAAEPARRSDPEGVQAERGAESAPARVYSEPDAPTTPAGKSRAKKAPRASTSKPRSSNPKPPPSGKKSASKKATRK